MTYALLNISITNDNILEDNETFALIIDPPSGITAVDPSRATVIIADDDSEKNIHIVICTYGVIQKIRQNGDTCTTRGQT